MKNADFDKAALTYDKDFSLTSIGILQREQVYSFLPEIQHIQVLEMNCGTGVDAIYFSQCGAKIIATDVSEQMLMLTKEKAQKKNLPIATMKWDLTLPPPDFSAAPFDLAFSNFGGWNCLNPEQIRALSHHLFLNIKPGGKLVVVWMPTFCLWETCYFLLKLKPASAFRRLKKKPTAANVEGVSVNTWYYSTNGLRNLLPGFKVLKTRSVGFFIPPSYLQPFFQKHTAFLYILHFLEKKIKNLKFFASFSDHAYIELVRLPL